MQRHHGQAGFTLLEVLVVLALVAMLTTVIFGGLRFGARAWAAVSDRSSAIADAGAIQDVMRRAVSRAYPAYAYSDYADRRIGFAGGSDSLAFIGPLPEAIEEGVLAFQRFYTTRENESLALNLAWRLDLPSSQAGVPIPESQVRLLDHVRSVRFAYFGTLDPQEPPRWRDAWVDQPLLPDLVRISVELDDPRKPKWPDLVIEPKITMNVACVYDPSSLSCRRAR